MGDTAISSGVLQMNVAGASSNNSVEKLAIRRGFRGSKYVFQAKVYPTEEQSSGLVFDYQDQENFQAIKLRCIAWPTSPATSLATWRRFWPILACSARSSTPESEVYMGILVEFPANQMVYPFTQP